VDKQPVKPTSFLESDTTISTDAAAAAAAAAQPQEPTVAAETGAAASASTRGGGGADQGYDPKPVLFKCGCDFGGVDVSMKKDQGLECDCSGTCYTYCLLISSGIVVIVFCCCSHVVDPIKTRAHSCQVLLREKVCVYRQR
jgi:hypothetical protein